MPVARSTLMANAATRGNESSWKFETSGNHLPTSARLLNRFQNFSRTDKESFDKWIGSCNDSLRRILNDDEIMRKIIEEGLEKNRGGDL